MVFFVSLGNTFHLAGWYFKTHRLLKTKKLGDLKPIKRLSLFLLWPQPPWRDAWESHCVVAAVTLSYVSLTTSLQNPPSLAVSNNTSAKLAGHIRASTQRTQQQWDTTAAGARRPGQPGQPAACPGQQESPRNPAMKHKQPLRTILLAAHSAKWCMSRERAGGERGARAKSPSPLPRTEHVWFTSGKHFF